MNKIQLVVCDLAGTTIRDSGQVTDAFTTALASHGLTVTPEQLNAIRGSSKRDAVRAFVPDGPHHVRQVEDVYTSFRRNLADRYRSRGVTAVPGVEDVFRWLRSHDVRVALNTGFDSDITELLLGALHWDLDTVDAVVCGDDVPEGRPAPHLIFRAMEACATNDAQQVANVGDTVLDLEAGHRAGVRWNIGVLSGAHGRRRLASAPHTHLLASIADLPDLWNRH